MLRTFNQAVGASIVVDTGLLIEYLSGTEAGTKIEEMIFKNPYITSIFLSPLTQIELYYLIRRKSSQERARGELDKIKKLTQSVPLEDYLEIVGEIKATTSFALADCATIGLGEYKNIKVIFKHEAEIDTRIAQHKNLTFILRLVFIDDFQFFSESKEAP